LSGDVRGPANHAGCQSRRPFDEVQSFRRKYFVVEATTLVLQRRTPRFEPLDAGDGRVGVVGEFAACDEFRELFVQDRALMKARSSPSLTDRLCNRVSEIVSTRRLALRKRVAAVKDS
jgi:hypothetical protein